ncbi:induced myeloid leukemia cell differentiation protein Mcl-1 homolog isoform X2 [Mus musculus]|uniref:induced myeloid leukemia cell differentiation protein Mcl-1 homolog isoform X2 n=1 Tax=Mus musculus TaxID=10090 RepID=UPI0003D700A4|nr:induced myeloid leukemia cell differentiation protein Mcl-1 homolog isoform X2 [Mus musculus]|eukprot:XP_006501151.1 PREDICTED: induced myeloid leukemia cell differentiation protein Mcl-1 homolog isoform X1 [Mus musculus]
MFGLRRNAVIGLNLYCGGASLGAGGGSPAGARLVAEEAKARREGGGEAALLPGARVVARPPPVGAEDPDVTASAERRLHKSPGLLAVPPEEMAASAAAAIVSPEEELDGCEPEAIGKRPAVLPLLERVSEAAKSSGADGSLPSTPPPPEEEEDDLYRQSLEIISRYLREQATGSKDSKPLGEAGAAGRRALETLRRVGDGVQRNHETAFQGWVCGVLPRTGPRRRHQKCAAGFCGCCWSRGWSGISNKIAL